MADRTDCRLTRDLMFEAVPYRDISNVSQDRRDQSIHILQPTSSQPGKLDPLGLQTLVSTAVCTHVAVLTNDEGDHGGSISSSGFQALDELFHLPDLDVLLGLVGLGVTHFGG
jgi:hypothetical protein